MKRSLLFIFGLPGAGKSYVADILHDHFGYSIHNGDDDLPQNMKAALLHKEIITDDMRLEFTHNMIIQLEKLQKNTQKLAVHQTLLKEFMREQLLSAFPDAKFILIQSDTTIRENRYMKRIYFNLGIEYLRHMSELFETPKIPHIRIDNSTNGKKYIVEKIKQLL